MVWFMGKCLHSQAGDPPPSPSLSPVSLQTHKPRISGARPSAERPGDAEPAAAGRGQAAESELNNLKTKSCDVWELLARALAWSGPICLLGPQCKGYFNLNSNVPPLQHTFEIQTCNACLL